MPEPAKDAAMGIFRELQLSLGRRPIWDAMPRAVRRIVAVLRGNSAQGH